MPELTNWLNKKRMKILLPLLLFTSTICMAQNAQVLTLEKVYDLARQNYPLIKQKELLQRSG